MKNSTNKTERRNLIEVGESVGSRLLGARRVQHGPLFVAARKDALGLRADVAAGRTTHGRVAVAEARRAAEDVLGVQMEVAGLAAVAALAFDVILADAGARRRVAARLAVQTAGHVAAARLAALSAKVVKVGVAPVALVARDARLARALALHVALLAARTCSGRYTHAIRPFVTRHSIALHVIRLETGRPPRIHSKKGTRPYVFVCIASFLVDNGRNSARHDQEKGGFHASACFNKILWPS